MITKQCPQCDQEFKTYPSINKKCCSRACSDAYTKQQTFNRYKQTCETCGVIFLPKRPVEGGQFCSYECSGKARRKERIDRNGYWYKCVPEHPRASKQGYVGEHTLIMEKYLGRYLEPDEVVHHKNHDRKDNAIENLELMTDSEHRRHHMAEQVASGLMNTEAQRQRASERMRTNNPSKNIRDSSG